MSGTTGVLLMTYGAPDGEADLPRYLAAVRGGVVPSAELLAEMRRRYGLIGGSPLVAITRRQAAALERRLATHGSYAVRAGMRFSEPSIEHAVAELLALGARRIVGICLSPQWSDLLMSGYERALAAALASRPDVAFTVVRDWFRQPPFVALLAERIADALAGEEGTPVILTAHSLPRRVFEHETGYVARLQETARIVAARAGLAPDRWWWAYQSAGHTAEEWLRPDLVEIFPALAAAGASSVLVAPVQFLADHLEVLYDLDVAAAEQASAAGLVYRRIDMPNDAPLFIEALADIAVEGVAATGDRAP